MKIKNLSAEDIQLGLEWILEKNKCKNLIIKEGHLVRKGDSNWFPLINVEHIQFDNERNMMTIYSELEYCAVDFTNDHMESFDKDSEVMY